MSASEHRVPCAPEVMDDVLATLTEDAEHDLVGFPGAPFHGHDELMGFYEVLLEQTKVHPVRRLHGPNFLVDKVNCRGRALNGLTRFDRQHGTLGGARVGVDCATRKGDADNRRIFRRPPLGEGHEMGLS